MTDVFLKVLNISYGAGWAVLAVVIARLLLKKAPRSLVCALWALVALRLVFGGIEAPFSLIPSPELIPPQSLFDQAPQLQTGVPIVDNLVNPIYTDSLRPHTGASVNPLQVWLAVLANVWGLGMLAMAAWAALSWLRVRRQVRESIRDGGVYLCDRIASPFLFGLLRPKIYLPSALDAASRAPVIQHEKAHLSRRDHWWKPLGFALLTIHWFNPMLWLAYLLLCRDIEMACDEKVVRQLSPEEKKAYSAALLGCSVDARRITACPLAFGEVGVKQRVQTVLRYKKPAFWVVLTSLVLIAALAAGVLTNPPERVSELFYGGQIYVLEDQQVSFLPVQGTAIGELVSILHHTDEHPTVDFQATNLDESLAGCPLYLEEDRIYLHKFDGTCMAFRLADHGQTALPQSELGITLQATNVTRNGATLVCTQDGTPWDSLLTGAQWDLEKFEDGQWVSLMPESTVWTTVAYSVSQGQTTSWSIHWSQIIGSLDPGHYRVSKRFTGERRPMFTLGLEPETAEQTCYAEFVIG